MNDGMTAMQRSYESGNCATPQGLNCYQQDQAGCDVVGRIQDLLDIAGLVPGFGEVADFANAMIYAAKGDSANAVLSLAAMLPIGGQGATDAKLFRKALMERTGVEAAQVVGKHAHHMLAQKCETNFARAGINTNDSQWGAWWSATDHLKNAYEFNIKWDQSFTQLLLAGQRQITDFAKQMANEYRIDWP